MSAGAANGVWLPVLTVLVAAAAGAVAGYMVAVRRGRRRAESGGAGAPTSGSRPPDDWGGVPLIDVMTEGVVEVDGAGRVRRANAAARALLGWPDDVEGRLLGTLVRHPELRNLLDCATGCESSEACELTLDGRHLAIAARRASPGAGTPGTLLLIRDLTDMRRLERIRRDFVANVSHELKTPLTSIRGYTETLLQEEIPPETLRQFLETVHRNAQRLQQIIEELLDLSRLEAGRWQPELEPVDVAEAARQAWASHEERALAKGVAFEIVIAEPLAAHADAGGLHQILSNLFDNAIRYTPGGGLITVSGGRTSGGRIAIEVRDTGVGIPQEALPRIFERFYRVDPARSRAEGGTGLGLSIVKHLVESMGGEVAARSELGRGTSIRLALPAASARAVASRQSIGGS